MQISEILSPDRIAIKADITSKKSALEEISRLLASSDPSLSHGQIFDCLNARERLGSTGLGKGVAIPHGRFDGIMQPTAAILLLDTEIDFDAVDKKPVDILFGLLVPAEATEKHLEILSSIATLCSDEKLLTKIRNETSADHLFDILKN